MKRTNHTALMALVGFALLASAAACLASDAETSASATGGRRRSGTASAAARYEGDLGFARTNTRTGALNAARAVALGVDRDGVSLSVSTAIAPQHGPAVATNFNMSIGTRGDAA
ncbi:MAG: hypothetical protein KAY37_15320, partial [Phycisphaerae bacterium]|nr:hypothetical protein [Phycisphaerae bacterium]